MTIDQNEPTHYVGIGASAGGLEAIEQLFKVMPHDSGATFIIIQHLSPDYKSLMPELLSKRTAMPVYKIENGMQAKANSVYLIPPRKNLTIFHGKLILADQIQSSMPNLPIDIFFKSLAEDQGSKAIAIELSGTGSDGTRGVRAIKEADGMVMVQSEESAKFDGMPRSVIATGLADFIITPQEMPNQLIAYINHPFISRDTTDDSPLLSDEDGLTRIYALLREHSRIDFTYYKPATVLRRIERRIISNQLFDINEYVRYMESHKAEISILHRELLIGVTNFFRDPDAFKIIAEEYLPSIISRVERREVRMWVAGCSTGEEAYTLAILCQEAMQAAGVAKEIKIFATDVDQHAIETAGLGRFQESIVTDVPSNLLSKYFIHHDDNYQISRSIREMVVFAQHNLIKDPPFTNIDFISCRNLLIYLQPVLQRKALELFNFSLVEGGVMMLGSSETIGEMGEYFEPLQNKWRVYRSRGRKKSAGLEIEPARFDQNRLARKRYTGSNSLARIQYEEEKILDRFLQTFADDYVQFAMVLNSAMEVVHAIGDTKNFLQMSPGMVTVDASKLIIKELSIPLSTGVQKVLKNGESLAFSKIRIKLDNKDFMMQMRIKVLPQKKGQDPLVAVIVTEMTERSDESSNGTGTTFDVSKETEERINDLEQELQFTRENLQATVEELETSNEELQATNEELLASNEELQSTNEELQSVNEELYTVNAEYQSKITELTELNNDLDNLLGSTNIGILFLDEDMEIRRYSSKITGLMNIIDSDIGRPIGHISHKLGELDLQELASTVLESRQMLEYEIFADDATYLVRSFPYKVASDVFAGVVVIFIDITENKQIARELEQSENRYRMALDSAKMGAWDWDITSDTVYWSDNLPAIFGLPKGQTIRSYKEFLGYIYHEDREELEAAVQHALKTGELYRVDHRIRMPSNELHWIREIGEVFCDDSGKAIRMIGTARDITERKLAENELRTISKKAPVALLIDDDSNMLDLLKAYVSKTAPELEVITAINGYEGLIKAGRYNPELIITDLLMPGMDGFELIRKVEMDALLKDIPLLAVTKLNDNEINSHGGLPEGVNIIRKPIEYKDMEQVLRTALAGK